MGNITNIMRRSLRIALNSQFLGCILLLSLIPGAGAQQKTARPISPRPHAVDSRSALDRELDSLSKKLKLSAEQKPRVRSILEKKDEQIKHVMENATLQRVDNRYKKYKKIAEIHDKSRAKIRKVLTEEQKTKFDKVDLQTY